MSFNVSSNRFTFGHAQSENNQRINDSLLVGIVFFIGLIGTCYILNFAFTNESGIGYYMDQPSQGTGNAESIYLTSSND